jgi:hypothetical protein
VATFETTELPGTQILTVEAPAGGDDAGQEGGISGPVAVHLASARIRPSCASRRADVSQVIAAEFVVDCDLDN